MNKRKKLYEARKAIQEVLWKYKDAAHPECDKAYKLYEKLGFKPGVIASSKLINLEEQFKEEIIEAIYKILDELAVEEERELEKVEKEDKKKTTKE